MKAQFMRFTTRPEIQGTFGVVASTHWLASQAAMGILEKGGNAFDAAVCAGFTLQVVEPHLNGPGGDVPIIAHRARGNETKVICGQGPIPAEATIEHYRSEGLSVIPGTGLLAAVVPGAFDAWLTLLRDYGTMRLAEVMEAAVGYAANGYPLVDRISATIGSVEGLFREHWPSSAAIYLPHGEVPKHGELFANPMLASCYSRIMKEALNAGGDREAQIEAARKAWYEGFVAAAIDDYCRTNEVMDVSGRPHKGVLNADDMVGWRASYEDPLTFDYNGMTIAKCGAWSQGPAMLQQLALLQTFGISDMDPEGPDFVHTIVECAKLAFADREAWYGDSLDEPPPVDYLLSEAYTAERRRYVESIASMDLFPGDVPGRELRMPDFPGAPGPGGAELGGGEPTVARLPNAGAGMGAGTGVGTPVGERGDTCHVDIIDRHGNMVSATPSGGWLQSSPIIPELGFCLGTRAQMCWLQEGLPASLRPGRRPRTTLSPSLALNREGAAVMAFGTPGGDQQDQWQVPFLLRHHDHGMNLQEAIDSPAFHSEHFPISFWPRQARPGVLVVENRFSKATVDGLRKRGHTVEVGDDWAEGRLSAARKDGTRLSAGANPRGMQGYAVGR